MTLRNSINKPDVYRADDPILTYGLLHLISLFENLPVALYDCICSVNEQGNTSRVTLTRNIRNALSAPISLEGVIETQQVDIRITQQWLQVMMWNLGLEAPVDRLVRNRAFQELNLPLAGGKCVMETLSSVSKPSIDVHGIGVVCSLRFSVSRQLLTKIVDAGAKTLRYRELRGSDKSLSAIPTSRFQPAVCRGSEGAAMGNLILPLQHPRRAVALVPRPA